MKAGLLAFGTLICGRAGLCAGPACAHADSPKPIGPLIAPAPQPRGHPAQSPARPSPPQPPPPRSSFRGTGEACSTPSMPAIGPPPAAGIAALPPSVLTPARQGRALHRQGFADGRPRADPGAARRSSRAAPGRAAGAHGAGPRRDHRAADHPQRRVVSLGSAPAAIAPGRSRASRSPISSARRSSLWSRPTTRPRRGAAAHQRRRCSRSKPAPRPRTASRGSIMCSATTPTPAGSPIPGGRRGRRLGAAGGLDLRPRLLAPQRLRRGSRRISSRSPRRARSASSAPAGIIGPRGRSRPAGGRAPSTPLLKAARALAGKLLRAGRPRTLGMDDQAAAPIPPVTRDPSIDHLPNVRRAQELAEIGETPLGRGIASPPGARSARRRSITP